MLEARISPNHPARHPARTPLSLHRLWECEVTKKTVISKKSVLDKTASKNKSTMKTSGRMSVSAKAPKKVDPRKSAKIRLPKGPIWQWSALETAAAIRSGEISSVQVVEGHIERMRAVN